MMATQIELDFLAIELWLLVNGTLLLNPLVVEFSYLWI